MYTLHSVTKEYRKGKAVVTALDQIDLAIGNGEFVAIQGRTGSGKTTLLQILGAMDRPTTGQALLDGYDLAALTADRLTNLRAHSIGFVFQAFNLIPTLTAAENVEAALVPLHTPADERRARAEEALVAVGLADRANHLPSELSGGQQQRVGIARAIVKQPAVILADEPTGNLDIETRDEIMTLLEQLSASHQLTLVVVTHDTSIAERAQRVVALQSGRLSDPSTPRGESNHSEK